MAFAPNGGVPTSDSAKPRLMDQVRDACRVRHFSHRTEEAYCYWIRQFLAFHAFQHPQQLSGPDVESFLTHLATTRNVSASTQNQALAALIFLYRTVLNTPLPAVPTIVRAKTLPLVPNVLTRQEIRLLLQHLAGVHHLVAAMLYGSGMRLLECLSLRIKDLDLERLQITVRQGKGRKDRVTTLPQSVVPLLRAHLETVRAQHRADLAAGLGAVVMPNALARKLPGARIDCEDW